MATKYCMRPDTRPIFPVDAPLGSAKCAAGVKFLREEDMPLMLKELLLVTAQLWTDTLEGNDTFYDSSTPGNVQQVGSYDGGVPAKVQQVKSSESEKPEGIPSQCVSAKVGAKLSESPTTTAKVGSKVSESKVSESPTSTRSTALNSGDHVSLGNQPRKSCAPKNVHCDLQSSENTMLLNQFSAAIKAASEHREDKAPKRKLKNMPVKIPKQSVPQTSSERNGAAVDASKAKGTESCTSDDDAEELSPESEEDDVEVIVGPTHFAFKDVNVQDMSIPTAGRPAPIISRVNMLALSDVRRLSALRKPTPLSFGSLLHISSAGKCRPCMFERAPGRCRKLWLCDFCHSHTGRKHRAVHVALDTAMPKPGPH